MIDNPLGEPQSNSHEKPRLEILVIPKAKMHGEWRIEIPDVDEIEKFEELVAGVIEKALKECLIIVQRKETTVRFLEKITISEDPRSGDSHNGSSYHIGAISLKDKDNRHIDLSFESIEIIMNNSPEIPWHIVTLFLLLHELFEEDYHIRSRWLHDKVPTVDLINLPDFFMEEYAEAEHELIAYARASRLLLIVFGVLYERSWIDDSARITIIREGLVQ